MTTKLNPGQVGDWLEVSRPDGSRPRRGLILEVLGSAGHEHYRVEWTDEHESIHYPSDGTRILRSATS